MIKTSTNFEMKLRAKNVIFHTLCFALSSLSSIEALPVLALKEELTWSQVFDAGFRPKHLSGLERRRCISFNDGFDFKLEKGEQILPLRAGRTSFDVLRNDEIWSIRHQETEPISLEEGRKRVDLFLALIGDSLVRKGTVPHVLDEQGTVDAGGNSDDNFAIVGDSMINFGFERSFENEKPLLVYLQVSARSRENLRTKKFGPEEKIPPPKGYEWYSLDPSVDTPSSGIKIELDSTSTVTQPPEAKERIKKAEEPDQKKKSSWLYWVLSALILGGVGLLAWNSRKGLSVG